MSVSIGGPQLSVNGRLELRVEGWIECRARLHGVQIARTAVAGRINVLANFSKL
jgi:hypothetical protein